MCQWGATASIDAIPHLVSGTFRLALFAGSHCIKSLLEGVQTLFPFSKAIGVVGIGECDCNKADGDWRNAAPNLGLRVKKSASKTGKGDDIVNIRDLGWKAILYKGCVLCAVKSQFLCVKLHNRLLSCGVVKASLLAIAFENRRRWMVRAHPSRFCRPAPYPTSDLWGCAVILAPDAFNGSSTEFDFNLPKIHPSKSAICTT